MSFLDKASSWELFSKTVFGEKSCPPELEEIGEKIVDNCRGLPLSIAVAGGLLKKMDATQASWESVQDNFTSVVNMNNDKHCLRLLKLSYNHLPVYLKPCFLYMGVFEEDEDIHVTTLVQRWVSEGFLRPTNGESSQTTARGFLQDLMDRNLILIGQLGSTGSLKSCKMHDLVRDMCLKESRKEGFYHVIEKCNPPHPGGVNAERRVVISRNASEEKVCGNLRFMSRTRSIICNHGKVGFSRNLLLLRTIQVHKRPSHSGDESSLVSLLFRYANLRHLDIDAPEELSFLPSFSPLWNLQTLSVSYFCLSEPILVADFWKMPQFRHLEFIIDCVRLPDPPDCDGDAVVIMENLHTLKGIMNFKCSEGVVKRIPNIKRLKLEYIIDEVDGDNDDEYHLGNIKNMCGLEFLSIAFCTSSSSSSSSITPMQKITFPQSLKKLSIFIDPQFEWDEIMLEKMGSLPLLEKLRLLRGCFRQGEWEIAQGQFPSLKYLELHWCGGLEKWTASEEDSSILPRLQHLHLMNLEELKVIPSELGNIDTLKKIEVSGCGEGGVMAVKEMFDDQVELQGGEDQLSFHVLVNVREEQQHLMSLAGTNFYVH